MKVLLHLREGITPAAFTTSLSRQIREGDHKAWEIVRGRPLTIRHKGRFKSTLTFAPASARGVVFQRPDVVVRMTGKDSGLVLRYLTYLLAIKLGNEVEGFFVPIDAPVSAPARKRRPRKTARATRPSGNGRRRRAAPARRRAAARTAARPSRKRQSGRGRPKRS
jgi:hypothetical protein